MKRLADDHEVEDRTYYYLLDWNERDEWKYINRVFNKFRLCDLTHPEYKMLFLHATSEDYKQI